MVQLNRCTTPITDHEDCAGTADWKQETEQVKIEVVASNQ